MKENDTIWSFITVCISQGHTIKSQQSLVIKKSLSWVHSR